MLFRWKAVQIFYRFDITCNGQERLDRVRAGVAYPLENWLSSNDVPLAAPAQIKLGVWAVGQEIRLFLNDTYQFSMTDPVFSSGGSDFLPMRVARARSPSPFPTCQSIPSLTSCRHPAWFHP